MSNKQQATKNTSPDDAIVIEAETSEHDDSVKMTKPPRRWPLFILAFIVGSATSIFGLHYYQQNYIQRTNLSSTPSTPSIEPPHVDATPTQPVQDNIDPTTTILTPETPIATAISSEEGQALLQSMQDLQSNIETLRDELSALRQKQSDVTHSQTLLEAMQLHSRLTWIMDTTSHLPQIKLAWQEISLLPSLSTEQRAQAEAMLQLAESLQNNVHQWKQELDYLISQLTPNEYDNILPAAFPSAENNPWLQWLIQQFSLKRSTSNQQAILLNLKNRLLIIKQNLDLELWPTGAEWSQLRAQLQLQLIEHEGKTPAKTLQLPESFLNIQKDIEQLRQAAHAWLEES